jgi:Na+/proline symporter
MYAYTAIGAFFGYALLLLAIAAWTQNRRAPHRKSRSTSMEDASGNANFFLAGRNNAWYLVAFGMIGASLSGVTFMSIPGWVKDDSWSYLQMVLGYLAGYAFIMAVLMPLYYRMQLTSIYGYFAERFGPRAHQTGAWLFIVSRLVGSSLRLYLVAMVLDLFVLRPLGWDLREELGEVLGQTLHIALLSALILLIIYAYTRRGGLSTVVWTDAFQTAAMLVAVVWAGLALGDAMGIPWTELPGRIAASDLSTVWVWDDWRAPNHAVKQFIAGAFIAIAMTGMDQDMMQKNLSCRSLKEARWNMGSFTIVLIGVNILFLGLGTLMWMYADLHGITVERSDALFPTLALQGGLGVGIGIVFLLGLMAAAFSSADSALTALTTSACVDIWRTEERPPEVARKIRKRLHLAFSLLTLLVMTGFGALSDARVVSTIFQVAGYTYGPLLGLFFFGLFTRRVASDAAIPPLSILSPFLCFGLQWAMQTYGGFGLGFALLPVNGAIMMLGLFLFSKAPGVAQPTTHSLSA